MPRQGLHPAEQGNNAGDQVLQADVLGQVIVRTQAQAGNDVEVGVTRRKENNGQAFGQAAQFPAQFKPSFRFIAQADIDNTRSGKRR